MRLCKGNSLYKKAPSEKMRVALCYPIIISCASINSLGRCMRNEAQKNSNYKVFCVFLSCEGKHFLDRDSSICIICVTIKKNPLVVLFAYPKTKDFLCIIELS